MKKTENPLDKILFCKMCNEEKKHMDLGEVMTPVRWKCKSCGEYSKTPVILEADNILFPAEETMRQMFETFPAKPALADELQMQELAIEMTRALKDVRVDVERLLEMVAPFAPLENLFDDYDNEENLQKEVE